MDAVEEDNLLSISLDVLTFKIEGEGIETYLFLNKCY